MAVLTPLDLLSKSLSDIGALAAGEAVEPNIANDAFDTLNDMLDQWSNQKMLLPCVQEVIHELTGGTYIYTIGLAGANVGSTITASIASNVMTVTALTAGALSVGQLVTGTGITTGTAITSYGTGRGGNGTAALGTYYLSIQNTFASGTVTTFAKRPIRINSGFVRVTNSLTGTLDYPISILTDEEYELIGIKTLSGPWPRAVYYQPSIPLGVLNYWPNPSSGEMHLFCDMILNRFTSLSETINMQPGAIMAMRWNLAELLMPSYGKNDSVLVSLVQKYAAQGRSFLRRSNMAPQQAARYDNALMTKRRGDAGWVLDGGFR